MSQDDLTRREFIAYMLFQTDFDAEYVPSWTCLSEGLRTKWLLKGEEVYKEWLENELSAQERRECGRNGNEPRRTQ